MVDFDDLKDYINDNDVDHFYINNPQSYLIRADDLVSMLNTFEQNCKYCFKFELLDALEGYVDGDTYELIESIMEEM